VTAESNHAKEQTPFQLLRSWELRVRRSGVALPREDETREQRWTGVGFFIDGEGVVAPMSQVREIGYYPKVTRVPGCKPWLRGLANLRGRLVAVVDLVGFLAAGRVTAVRPRSRVIEVRDESVPVGLLVAEMAGLRHFREGQQVDNQGVAAWLAPYFTSRIVDEKGAWTVLDLNRIVRHPEFLRVAL